MVSHRSRRASIGLHQYLAGLARCWGEVFQGLGQVYHWLGGVSHAFGWMYHWLTWISHELARVSHGLGLISRGLRWISNGPVISQALISWAGPHPAAKVKR